MAISSLKGVINGDFVKRIAKVGAGKDAGLSAAMRGDTTDLRTSLRTGARNFVFGLQSLNVSASFVNLSENTHQKLMGIVGKLEEMTALALDRSVGREFGDQLTLQFRQLRKEFKATVSDAEFRGKDFLDPAVLTEELINTGLDPEKNPDLKDAVGRIRSLTQSSSDANGDVQRPDALMSLDTFQAALRQAAAEFEQFDVTGEEPTTEKLKEVKKDLGKLRSLLSGNLDALNDVRTVLIKNSDLIRASGNAFLEMSNSLTGAEDADRVAGDLRELIRKNAGGALAQAENLQSIVVAGLTLDPTTLERRNS